MTFRIIGLLFTLTLLTQCQKLNLNVSNVYIDATHLTEKSRAKVINSLPTANYILTTVFFDIPLETCLERNEQREGRAKVPRSVIRRMYACFEKDTQYGLDKVYVREENENDISNIRHAF